MSKLSQCGIYKISCSNGFYYFGRSSNIAQRLLCHKSKLRAGSHYIEKLQDDFIELGIKNFKFEIFNITQDMYEASKLERRLIKEGIKSGKLYNTCLDKSTDIRLKNKKGIGRIVAYLDDDMLEFMNKKADAIRVSHSFLVREMILKEMFATVES